jgi:multidrug efflux pump subunit AcrB
VVDDAIVMIEHARYLEQGDSPLEAARRGRSRLDSPLCR